MAPSTRRGRAKKVEPQLGGKAKIVEQELGDFVSIQAKSAVRILASRKVILERGIFIEIPFQAYIEKHGWEEFCNTPGEANMTMVNEFYANLRYQETPGLVLCRGKMVSFSATAINEYFKLPTDTQVYKEYKQLTREVHWDEDERVGDWDQVIRDITKPEVDLQEIVRRQKWSNIDKKHLTTEMNVWYTFIAARLLPVTINSEIHWERVRLLYAIKKGMKLNVGSLIYGALKHSLSTSSGIGFHSLITGLCHRAGCTDRTEDTHKPPMAILTYEAFQRRVKVFHPSTSRAAQVANETGGTDEGLGEIIKTLARKVNQIESIGNYVKLFCEHTAKVLSYEKPEAISSLGQFPVFPNPQVMELEDGHEATVDAENHP